ncbi:MAG: lipocalin-like domain-containing protein [Planctomycetota bacterium]
MKVILSPLFVLAALFGLVGAALSKAQGTKESWRKITPDLRLEYPRDHGSHPETQSEWWYLTGQLMDEDGRRFGYQFTIFRGGLSQASAAPETSPLRASQVFAGHLAVTDLEAKKTHHAERLRRAGMGGLASASTADMDLVLEDWTLVRDDEDRLIARASDRSHGIGVEFTLEPQKPLVRQGVEGYSAKGVEPGNASAYVSWTRLATSGTLTVNGEARLVTGSSWFDHEFGSSVLGEGVVGWDWFGLQLEDERELMLFVLRKENGEVGIASAATWIERDGNTVKLAREQFTVTPLDTWTSPRSDATYPAAWRLEFDSGSPPLEVRALVPDCELSTTRSTGVTYWEGPVEVMREGAVYGRGYAELTGYAGTMSGRL